MGATDKILARYAAEAEEHQNVIESLAADAEKNGRDLGPKEMEMIEVRRDRLQTLNEQMEPLKETSRIGLESRARISELHDIISMQTPERQAEVEYRSAGAWIVDYWKAALGSEEATRRIRTYEQRAASHQTTADNPGLLPEQILGPVINFVDESRPLIGFFGARDLPSGSWSRPRVTQHTAVGIQAGEKTELTSRKMVISKIPVAAQTVGGYVNVSKQDDAWSNPNIMDLVISDLAGQYAIFTENMFADALMAAATAETPIPTGPATAAAVSAALWAAVGHVYTATQGVGRLFQAVSPDMLGLVGPLFAPVNPQNSQSTGFSAGEFGVGTVGQISGVPVIVSAGLDVGSWIVGSTSGAEFYEDRLGALQVIEPSVLGVQVAYAGFASGIVLEPTSLRKIAKTP